MPVRSSMADLVARTRLLIADPASATQQFDDQQIQDALDQTRDTVRYELLAAGPTIVNTASTGNVPGFIWADYYSAYPWWEADVVLQGNLVNTGVAWAVLSPAASDLLTGHWQFELTPFVNGTVPGQYPPVFATGHVYDLYRASADLLDWWAASLARAYDFTSDGQNFRRSQMAPALCRQAEAYRRRARPQVAAMGRRDIESPSYSQRVPLLGNDTLVNSEG